MDIVEYSQQIQKKAQEILDNSELFSLWKEIGAEIYLVGSLKTGLLIHRDIDLHIYTEEISVHDSFSVISKLADRLNIMDLWYKNLIETEEKCLEWHVLFEDENKEMWKLDMIHIRKGSRFDGVVEKITDAIAEKLNPKLRQTILQIKYDMPKNNIIPGIEVYHAVFTGKVKTYKELMQWRETNSLTNSFDWMP